MTALARPGADESFINFGLHRRAIRPRDRLASRGAGGEARTMQSFGYPRDRGQPRMILTTYDRLPFLMVDGSINGMKLKIDKAGRIVVPKPLRERLGFMPDMDLEAVEQPDGVLLKRAQQRPSMVKVDGLWVHQGRAEPGANWERILEDVREERIASVLKA